jgi:hypothetical protein
MAYRKVMRFIVLCLFAFFLFPGVDLQQFQKEAFAKGIEKESVSVTDPGNEFQKARESFLKKDLKASAEEIRRGIAYLESIEAKAEDNRAKAYQKSFQNLHEFADRVENGTVASVTELDQRFARTYYTIANYHYLKALESWTKKETLVAGQELKAAAAYLGEGAKHMREEMKTGVGPVIDNSRLLAEKMVNGAGWTTTEVENGIKVFGAEMEKLEKKVSKTI